MISRLLRCAAAVAIAAGVTAAAPAGAAVAAPVAAYTASAPLTCAADAIARGFLNDGSGNGTAMSLLPHTTPYDTEPFSQRSDSDAWEMCYLPDNTLRPEGADTKCAANDSGQVKLHACNPGLDDQQWTIPNVPGSFQVRSHLGGFLCAEGGVTFIDIVTSLAGCSDSYHNTWEFVAG